MSNSVKIILEMLRKRKDCPTAEKIYMELKNEIQDITLRKVSIILQNLCEEGSIIKIKSRTGRSRKI
jgi:Fe2+ or Zn2+ uptake regulation protein